MARATTPRARSRRTRPYLRDGQTRTECTRTFATADGEFVVVFRSVTYVNPARRASAVIPWTANIWRTDPSAHCFTSTRDTYDEAVIDAEQWLDAYYVGRERDPA